MDERASSCRAACDSTSAAENHIAVRVLWLLKHWCNAILRCQDLKFAGQPRCRARNIDRTQAQPEAASVTINMRTSKCRLALGYCATVLRYCTFAYVKCARQPVALLLSCSSFISHKRLPFSNIRYADFWFDRLCSPSY